MREEWDGMKTITGCKKKGSNTTEGDAVRANQLNLLYNRFDSPAVAARTCPPSTSLHTLPSPPPTPTPRLPPGTLQPPSPPHHHQRSGELKRLRPSKAAGPDGVCPRMLKACSAELEEPLQCMFNLSLQLGRVPVLWKTSCLINVPKKKHPREPDDFRPVAPTSHMMKTM
ncbi:uncharacterized protein LOC115014824 isoform X2 [Cottoperca gobio]|nr:uncharacterized protein LOC115014824 isoform X2 [Cottoperca gobio]XP_029297765.1 uncharacterized protein LOC115014824 isoform X2 [Cottoperca gobio]